MWPDWEIFGLRVTFQSLWQQLICPNRPHSYAIIVKVSKSLIFQAKSFLVKFKRHLATFYWSHWLQPNLQPFWKQKSCYLPPPSPVFKIVIIYHHLQKSTFHINIVLRPGGGPTVEANAFGLTSTVSWLHFGTAFSQTTGWTRARPFRIMYFDALFRNRKLLDHEL